MASSNTLKKKTSTVEVKISGFDNPAFDSSEGSVSSRVNGDVSPTPSTSNKSGDKDSNSLHPPLSKSPSPSLVDIALESRRSSVADVAIAYSGAGRRLSPDGPVLYEGTLGSKLFKPRASFDYVHPFGNATCVLEELFDSGQKKKINDADMFKADTGAPVKMVVWLVMCFFLVGIAGAIVFASETYDGGVVKRLENNTTNTSAFNSFATRRPYVG